ALKHLGRAEHFYRHEMTAGQKAEVVYFKARCLEMMGHPLEAARLYEYLIGSHPGTEYSARARGRIEEIHQTRTNPPAPALPTAPPVQ
ncbi:MAG: hypothetical protein QG602_1839, partial [Verrucomicrobiota bacterium]|nr:hypothetical protein [Verrucomicrobiota bacterium]